MTGAIWTKGNRGTNGRSGRGSTNHCAHGKGSLTETVLDWQPMEYITSEQIEGKQKQLASVTLEEIPGGTRYTYYFRAFLPLPAFLRKLLIGMAMKWSFKFDKKLALLAELLKK